MNVGQIILQQLGGRRFIMMTGASNFTSGLNSLTMTLPRNKSDATHLRIVLEPMNWYKLTFMKCKLRQVPANITVLERDMVYCDRLEDVFTEVTGLYTRL